ncbi:DUF2642 domain-containing protein [Paenibacillus sp. MBLB4367]|uniref:DUF2642 domain-containing protein n=1 Tax=Paenibacillus sp. MBLB4367 TaxID=3384767 RepID=UPI003907F67E
MNGIRNFLGKHIDVNISGKGVITGLLIDLGSDIMVIHDGFHYLYIPLVHIQSVKLSTTDLTISELPEQPIENHAEPISYRKMLVNAKGLFLEIYTSGGHSIHGYLTGIMNDYFVFYSPVYHTVFISMNHLKYLIPYQQDMTPYSLNQEYFPVKPSNITLARTFEQQIKKLEGKFVVLDMDEHPRKIGLLKSFEDLQLELVTANGETFYWNMHHIKTVHLP